MVDYLIEKHGFKHYSSREFIRAEVAKRGLADNRDSMMLVANDMRAAHSASYIIEHLWREARTAGGDAVIESIRTVGEVEFLRRHADFKLIAVTADPKTRYERNVKRGSSTDHVSFDHFLEQEKQEMASVNPNKQNLHATMSSANFVIYNDGTLPELWAQVESVLQKIMTAEKRN